jgi:hypothetical protein
MMMLMYIAHHSPEIRILPPRHEREGNENLGSVSVIYNSYYIRSNLNRARATSAAPRYFKPFCHAATGRVFADGALKFNNPVRIADNEMKLLWPDKAHPDILLSIGTGLRQEPNLPASERPNSVLGSYSSGLFSHFKNIKAIITAQIEHNLNSQHAWDSFIDARLDRQDEDITRKYTRLNLEYPDTVPALDDFEGLPVFEAAAESYCKVNESFIRDTAVKLIASLFYLELNHISKNGEAYCCKGLSHSPFFSAIPNSV